MAEPLHAEPEQPVEEPEPERVAARATASAGPEFEDEAQEPSLFESHDGPSQVEAGLFHSDEDEDMPQPAYRPEREARDAGQDPRAGRGERQPRPEYAEDRYSDRPSNRPADRPARAEPPRRSAEPPRRSAGTPTPETMARLQAAVRKRPVEEEPARRGGDGERQKFGINGLIGRMTGHPQEAERAAAPVRRQPPVQAEPDTPARAVEDERIEIPAFLRRQAN